MKCQSCDHILSDYEATIKHAVTGEHLDLCMDCLEPIKDEIPITDRPDLLGKDMSDD